MPLYTALIEEGSVPEQTKAKIAEDITNIHTAVMKVPRSFVRVIFLSYPLMQLWEMFQHHTGIATNHLAISLREIPATNAMEMGQIMRPVDHASSDTTTQ